MEQGHVRTFGEMRARVEIHLLDELNRQEEQQKQTDAPRKKKIEIRSAKQSIGSIHTRFTEKGEHKRCSEQLECTGTNKQNCKEDNKPPSRELSKGDCISRNGSELAPKRPCKKDQLAYSHLLRKFNQALKMTGCSRILTQEKVGEILGCLSFVNLEESQEDRQLLLRVYDMLSRKQEGGVVHDDLFCFLVVLCNIQLPDLKVHDQSCELSTAAVSHWSLQEEDRKSIRKHFSKLYLNKISNDRTRRLSFEVEEPSFQPAILNNSRTMALSKRSKLLQEARTTLHETSINPLRASIDVADYLLLNRRLSEQKLSQKKKANEDRELDGCTFHPKVNRFDTLKTEESDPRKDRNQHLYESYKPITEKCKNLRPTAQQLELKQLKQCTFKPASTKYVKSKHHMTVRHEDKSVQRLKEGYEMRLLMKTIKERGYPNHINNWHKFFKGYKKSTANLHDNVKPTSGTNNEKWKPSQKNPILSIDLKLVDRNDSLEVYDGDSIESLTCKILVRHGLSYEYKSRVWQLIETTLERNSNLIVFNGFVYEKR